MNESIQNKIENNKIENQESKIQLEKMKEVIQTEAAQNLQIIKENKEDQNKN